MCSNLTWEQDGIRASTWKLLILGLIQGVTHLCYYGQILAIMLSVCENSATGSDWYSSPPTRIYRHLFFECFFLCFFFFLFGDDSRGMGKRVMHCPFLCTVYVKCSPTHHDSVAVCCLTKHPKTFSAPWSTCTNWRSILTGLLKNFCLVYNTCNCHNVTSNYYFLHVQTFRTFYNNLWRSTAQSPAEVVMEQTGS